MNTISPWEDRPFEIANLLNPAFCSVLLWHTISNFNKKANSGFDYPLTFLVLTLVLSKNAREILPSTTRSKMHVWVQEHQEVLIGLDEKIYSLMPYTKEALIFGMQFGLFDVDEKGKLISSKLKHNKYEPQSYESNSCIDKSILLGKWFANNSDVITTLSMWGVKL